MVGSPDPASTDETSKAVLRRIVDLIHWSLLRVVYRYLGFYYRRVLRRLHYVVADLVCLTTSRLLGFPRFVETTEAHVEPGTTLAGRPASSLPVTSLRRLRRPLAAPMARHSNDTPLVELTLWVLRVAPSL